MNIPEKTRQALSGSTFEKVCYYSMDMKSSDPLIMTANNTLRNSRTITPVILSHIYS